MVLNLLVQGIVALLFVVFVGFYIVFLGLGAIPFFQRQ